MIENSNHTEDIDIDRHLKDKDIEKFCNPLMTQCYPRGTSCSIKSSAWITTLTDASELFLVLPAPR